MGACLAPLSILCKICMHPEVHAKNIEESPTLSYEQAHEILSHIESARTLLNTYAHISQNNVVPRRKSWWGRHCWPDKRRFLYRFVTVITIFIQVLNLTIITVIDTWPRHDSKAKDFLLASSVSMIALQLINLVFLILASGRLVKQIYRHSVNGLFLAQSYGATILLFAGLYTLTYRLERNSWRFVSENFNDNPVQVFVLYAKFLFYSISTATLCGSDNVLPVKWYNCIFAGFQMLLSFCYFASILGSSVAHDGHPFSSQNANKKSPSLARNRRRGKSTNEEIPTPLVSPLLLGESDTFSERRRASSVPAVSPKTSLLKKPNDRKNVQESSPSPSLQSYSSMGLSSPVFQIDNESDIEYTARDDRSFFADATVHYVSDEKHKKSKGWRK